MSKEYIICAGTVMEGFDIDIVKYAGIENLTTAQYDILQDEVSDVGLLDFCSSYHLNPHEDVAAAEDQDFFYLATYDEAAFKAELRLKIYEILQIACDTE